jgi:hypothetical protein
MVAALIAQVTTRLIFFHPPSALSGHLPSPVAALLGLLQTMLAQEPIKALELVEPHQMDFLESGPGFWGRL